MRFIETGGNPKLNAATDGQLFALMGQRGSEAKGAWAEFYIRYVNDLYKAVHRLRGLSATDVEGVVQDTMVQAWKAALTFQADDGLEESLLRDRTLSWLCRIAQNLYFAMRRQRRINLVSGSDEEDGAESSPASTGRAPIRPGELHRTIQCAEALIEGAGQPDEEIESNDMRLLREALATLTEREWDILMTTYEYHERGRKQQRLPQAVIDELCQAYDISPEYLRKIRERAHKQVIGYSKKLQATEETDEKL